jgi:hypothetical protein
VSIVSQEAQLMCQRAKMLLYNASLCVWLHLYWVSTHTSPEGREESKGAPYRARAILALKISGR